MRRSLLLTVALMACEREPRPSGFAQISTEVQTPDQAIELAGDDNLREVVCLRMDQLAMNRAALKQIGGRTLAGLMVDISPRQAEEYAKTGKLPSSNKIEEREARKDMFDRMMDIADVQGAAACFDEAIDECLKSGGDGMVCFDMASKTCKRFDLKMKKSHCAMKDD